MYALNLGCGHDVQRWQPCLRAGIVYLVPDSIQDFCGGRMEWSVYTCGLHRTNAPSSVIAHWSGAPSHGVMVPSECRGQASVQVTRSSVVRWYIAHRCVVYLGIRCFQKKDEWKCWCSQMRVWKRKYDIMCYAARSITKQAKSDTPTPALCGVHRCCLFPHPLSA
jgi:hypothetical protein